MSASRSRLLNGLLRAAKALLVRVTATRGDVRVGASVRAGAGLRPAGSCRRARVAAFEDLPALQVVGERQIEMSAGFPGGQRMAVEACWGRYARHRPLAAVGQDRVVQVGRGADSCRASAVPPDPVGSAHKAGLATAARHCGGT